MWLRSRNKEAFLHIALGDERQSCVLLTIEYEKEQVCDNIRTKSLAKSEVSGIIGQFSELGPGDIIKKTHNFVNKNKSK